MVYFSIAFLLSSAHQELQKKGLKLYWQNTFWLPFNTFICFPVMLVIVMKQ